MTLYNVHIYREMRLFFPGIEAATPGEAARIAADKPTPDAEYTEDCDGEDLAALVNVVGDEDFSQSVTIDFEAERLRKAAPKLLAALNNLTATARTFRNVPEENQQWTSIDDAALEEAFRAIAEATATHQPTIERRMP